MGGDVFIISSHTGSPMSRSLRGRKNAKTKLPLTFLLKRKRNSNSRAFQSEHVQFLILQVYIRDTVLWFLGPETKVIGCFQVWSMKKKKGKVSLFFIFSYRLIYCKSLFTCFNK